MLAIDETPEKGKKSRRASIPQRVLDAIAARTVTLTIPNGPDGYWTLIRYLDGRGGFTVGDATRRLPDDAARSQFADYIGLLIKAGYVVAHKAGGQMLRIVKQQPEAPRLTAAGKQRAVATRQQLVWNAMKMLTYFSVSDLLLATSAGMRRDAVERYLEALVSAGYLVSREMEGRKLYRMKPGMWTGPVAPQVLRANFVWDANLCRVVGTAIGIEEIRS